MMPQVTPEIPIPIQPETQDADDVFVPRICPILTLGGKTFMRDLPELLRRHHGQWVAYHGDRRVGIRKTHREMYPMCEALGIPRDEVLFYCIESLPEFDTIGLLLS